ncbi:DNA polymerase III subunit delta' [Labrys wisconsinensis]|uniref:DNA polymerase-3 subunit delta n=1 Tax=Labrys wisconsinensis TaxID=425677 RepID=A0ABU0J5F9_9HYPH|nr:DNA polymerase III subunit delta' [Labrys wisconsinensis]MDQ0468796.1 DNA polymerase-3 subunit delta' [Labrys wisconsinensis]
MSDTPEIDRLDDTPHPRETAALIGHDAAERALLEAYRSGRIHHAWILGGPEGIGKATLAYRMAKFVLTHPDPTTTQDCTDLAVPPQVPAARQVASQSHVDLKVLRRTLNDDRKSFGAVIKVEDVRQAVAFFGSTAGGGGWRIAIVDAADDFNAAGANALLKVLEEPPARALFLIVSHQPGRLLPTIRSRCRRLTLEALSADDTVRAAALARPDLPRPALEGAARIAQGSVRRTLVLAEGEGVALHQALLALLARLPDIDVAAVHALADRCAGKAGDANFELMLAFLEDWLHERLTVEQGAPAHRLARWAEVWDKARDAARDVEVYNLERKPFVLSTFSMLARASRS